MGIDESFEVKGNFLLWTNEYLMTNGGSPRSYST